MADNDTQKPTAVNDAMEQLRKAGVLPGEREPLSEEEQKPLSDEARAQLWGDASSKGMWVVQVGLVGWIIVVVLLCLSVAAFVYGARTIGGAGVVVAVALVGLWSHRIGVDRRAKRATFRFGFMPFFCFSYPLEAVSIEHQSTFSLTSKKSHNMLYWNAKVTLNTDENGRVQPTIADGFRPTRTQLISTKDRARVVALKRRIEALLDPPPLA